MPRTSPFTAPISTMSFQPSKNSISKDSIRASFSRAADSYEQSALVQRQVLELLDAPLEQAAGAQRILEIGTGTGLLSRRIIERFSPSLFVSLDITPEMTKVARARLGSRCHLVAADGEALPFRKGPGFQLAVSASTFQWFFRLPESILEIVRTLVPGGLLAAIFFSKGTLAELEEALSKAAGRQVRLIPSGFWDRQSLESELADAFHIKKGRPFLPVRVSRMEMEEFSYQRTYPSLVELLRTFKQTGTSPTLKGRGTSKPMVTSPGMLRRVEEVYLDQFGEIRATYKVIRLVLQRA